MKRNDFAVRTLESAEVRGEQCQRHGQGQVTETVCKHCPTHGLLLDSARLVYVELCPERYDGVRRGTTVSGEVRRCPERYGGTEIRGGWGGGSSGGSICRLNYFFSS